MTNQPEQPQAAPRNPLAWPETIHTVLYAVLVVVMLISVFTAMFALGASFSGGFGIGILVQIVIAVVLGGAVFVLERRRVAAWAARGVKVGRAAR